MARFIGTNYKYYNEKNELIGTEEGFLKGLSVHSNAAYVDKYINDEFKERITVFELKETNYSVKGELII